MSMENKILNLIKSQNPTDPLEYTLNIIKEYSIEKLNQCILSCSDCGISSCNKKSIFCGNHNAKIMFIGESIPKDCNDLDIYKLQKGYTAETITKIIDNLELDKKNLCYINCVNCFPHRVNNNEIMHRTPLVEERDNCSYFVKKAIDIVRPYVIISLGAVPTNLLLRLDKKDNVNITSFRGTKFIYNNIDVIPTFNPMYFIEAAARKSEEEINILKSFFIEDIESAIKIAKEKEVY